MPGNSYGFDFRVLFPLQYIEKAKPGRTDRAHKVPSALVESVDRRLHFLPTGIIIIDGEETAWPDQI